MKAIKDILCFFVNDIDDFFNFSSISQTAVRTLKFSLSEIGLLVCWTTESSQWCHLEISCQEGCWNLRFDGRVDKNQNWAGNVDGRHFAACLLHKVQPSAVFFQWLVSDMLQFLFLIFLLSIQMLIFFFRKPEDEEEVNISLNDL